jgi:hypothetical protein
MLTQQQYAPGRVTAVTTHVRRSSLVAVKDKPVLPVKPVLRARQVLRALLVLLEVKVPLDLLVILEKAILPQPVRVSRGLPTIRARGMVKEEVSDENR